MRDLAPDLRPPVPSVTTPLKSDTKKRTPVKDPIKGEVKERSPCKRSKDEDDAERRARKKARVAELEERLRIIAREVKTHLKPHFESGAIDRETYKKILGRAVDKTYSKTKNDSSESRIFPEKVKKLVDAYVEVYS